MWIFFAFGSALFAGLTAILAKCGIRKTDSTVATAIRTIVVLAFSWLMVFITGSQGTISSISGRTLLFLVLSGLATGASWLCYFRALQLGDVNKVVPIDKSSTVLTILLAAIFLREGVSLTKGIGVVLIAAGTFLMIEKKESTGETKSAAWLWYALGSAVFASLTAILGKVGISGVESNLGTAIRTGVVLVMSWLMVFVTGKQLALRGIPQRELGFICLSGIATGGSWLCYYKALQDGPASVVVPIDKRSPVSTFSSTSPVSTPSASASAATGVTCGMKTTPSSRACLTSRLDARSSSVPRLQATIVSEAPSLTAVRAQSSAVSPPPSTTARCPAKVDLLPEPDAFSFRKASASTNPVRTSAAKDGMTARPAPVATNTAS